MMKQNLLSSVLVALLFISGTVCSLFAVRYGFRTRELRTLQPKVMNYNNRLAIAQSLLNDTIEYSKRNPAIDPLLKSLNIKTNVASATTPPAPSTN